MEKELKELSNKETKKAIIVALQEALEPYIGTVIDKDQLKSIGSLINNFFVECVNKGMLDKNKWDQNNTIIVQEKNKNEIDIILPDWIYEWMNDEAN